MIVDADSHLYEPRGMWADYADPAQRDLALELVDDELGYTWLAWRGRRLFLTHVFRPNDVVDTGRRTEAWRRGEPSDERYDDALPADYWDPDARGSRLDALGIDESVLFPNHGLLWERALGDDLDAMRVNLGAWNRWAVAVVQQGRGRLHPVGHVTLRDLDWLDRELAALAQGGVRLAMTPPALVDGRPLSHPDLDRAWSAFEHHGITPVFHVAGFDPPFHEGWIADDFDQANPVLASSLLWLPAALALGDLAVHGTLARHPDLRIGVMELSARWYSSWLQELDGAFAFHAAQNGRPFRELERTPAEYVRDHVRIAAFSYERPDVLTRRAGDVFMFCSDYPHGEGTATPLEDYERTCGTAGTPEAAPALFGGNVGWLLRRDRSAP